MRFSRKSLIATIFIIIIILLSATSVEKWNVRANEYFGDGVMLITKNENFTGVIMAWGIYAVHGTAQDCRIVPIYSEISDAQTVSCGIKYNKKQNKFSGWMNFRGHPRPFCGTKGGGFPDKCFEE